VEKLGLTALLCQTSHFPVFDWLPTSLKNTQSANIFSVATQVNLSFQCGAAAGFFLPRSIACAFGYLALGLFRGVSRRRSRCPLLNAPWQGVFGAIIELGVVKAETCVKDGSFPENTYLLRTKKDEPAGVK